MKKFPIYFFLLANFSLYSQSGWFQKDSLPSSGRCAHITFVIGNIVYSGLGAINWEQRIYSAEMFKYNPSDNSWAQLDDFPGGARYGSSAFSLKGKGYICLGVDANFNMTRDGWEFDPVTEIWQKKSDFPGGDRYHASSFVIEDQAYLVSGSINQGNNYLNDLWCYDPETDTWTQKESLPTDHLSQPVTFSNDGKGYAVSGSSSTNDPVKDFYQYDPITNTWSQLSDLPGKRTAAVGFVIGDKAYVGSGTDFYLTFKSFWCYSFETNTWSNISNPPADFSQRIWSTAFSLGNTGYVLAGRSEPYDSVFNNGRMLKDLWVYTPCILPEAGFTYQVNDLIVNYTDSSSMANQYYWDFGDGYASYLKNPVHHYEKEGNYYVCLTVEDSCGSDIHCDTVHTCNPLLARFTNQNQGHFVIFSDSSEHAINWYWDFGDGFMSLLQNPVHYYQGFGMYHVCLTVNNNCETKECCDSVLVMTNNIDKIPVNGFCIFPNPVRDLLNIRWFGIKDKNTLFAIFNYCGEVLNGDYLSGLYEDRIDVESLQPGLYFIRIIGGDNVKIARFIKAE
jgi:PKD repeat protein